MQHLPQHNRTQKTIQGPNKKLNPYLGYSSSDGVKSKTELHFTRTYDGCDNLVCERKLLSAYSLYITVFITDGA